MAYNPEPFTLHAPASTDAPLFLDSPHSGAHYPADFHFICDARSLRQTEDMYVDALLSNAPHLGIGLLQANVARSYIDVNRARDDVDFHLVDGALPFTPRPTERSLAGHGLIRHLCRGQNVYELPLAPHTIMQRIEGVYDVYHHALERALADIHRLHGHVFLINCHSMPSPTSQPHSLWQASRAPADIVLGDRDGIACDPLFVSELARLFRAKGYLVAHNDPYRGVEIVRRWGRPREGFHAVQLEISRRLYMDEENLVPHTRFETFRTDLEHVLQGIKNWVLAYGQEEQLAAE